MSSGTWGNSRIGAAFARCPAACRAPALALAALIPAVPAAAADTATVNVDATMLTPGSIAKLEDMDFGTIVQPSTAGTVVMTASSTPTCTTTGGLIQSGNCTSAHFAIYGIRNWRVRIRATNGGVVTLNGPAGATMTMNNITIQYTGLTPRTGGGGWNLGNYDITDASGTGEFYLGGTLNVGALQAAGIYNGTINIQIQFN